MFPEGTGLCILISIAAIVSVVTVQHQIILHRIFSLSLCFIKIFNVCEVTVQHAEHSAFALFYQFYS